VVAIQPGRGADKAIRRGAADAGPYSVLRVSSMNRRDQNRSAALNPIVRGLKVVAKNTGKPPFVP
jgi:hypothetical protein